jgi:hypothetical protein
MATAFERVEEQVVRNPYAPPWENRKVLLCRGPKNFQSVQEVWPKVKRWDWSYTYRSTREVHLERMAHV